MMQHSREHKTTRPYTATANNTIQHIVEVESEKKTVNEDVQSLNIEGKCTNNPRAISSAFNEYFHSLVEKTYLNNNNNNNINKIYYVTCLYQFIFKYKSQIHNKGN
jgi:hypothetical protein